MNAIQYDETPAENSVSPLNFSTGERQGLILKMLGTSQRTGICLRLNSTVAFVIDPSGQPIDKITVPVANG